MEKYSNSKNNGVHVQMETHLVVVKDGTGDMVMFTRNEWRNFVELVKRNEYDI